MNKSVIISIQPYWVFLIIAKAMGWDIPQEKTIEVRKDFPKDKLWNKVTHIYCGNNRKSFNRIPKQYQPFMKKLLGKVIGEFVCDRIEEIDMRTVGKEERCRIQRESCLTREQLTQYLELLTLYKKKVTAGKYLTLKSTTRRKSLKSSIAL